MATSSGLKSCVNICEPARSEAEIAEANIKSDPARDETGLHRWATHTKSKSDNAPARRFNAVGLSQWPRIAYVRPWIVGISIPEPYETLCG